MIQTITVRDIETGEIFYQEVQFRTNHEVGLVYRDYPTDWYPDLDSALCALRQTGNGTEIIGANLIREKPSKKNILP